MLESLIKPSILIKLNIGCITNNCKKPKKTRGLCHKCYTAYRKLVLLGKTTWNELEHEGKSLPIRSIEERRSWNNW